MAYFGQDMKKKCAAEIKRLYPKMKFSLRVRDGHCVVITFRGEVARQIGSVLGAANYQYIGRNTLRDFLGYGVKGDAFRESAEGKKLIETVQVVDDVLHGKGWYDGEFHHGDGNIDYDFSSWYVRIDYERTKGG